MLSFCWDNCGGQNKNQFIAHAMIYNVNKTTIDKIHLHFLYEGHTFIAHVSNFGNIEKNLKQKNYCILQMIILKTILYRKDKKANKRKNNCPWDASTRI